MTLLDWYYFACTLVWLAVFALTLASQRQQHRRMDAITENIAILSGRTEQQQYDIGVHASLLAAHAADLSRKANR